MLTARPRDARVSWSEEIQELTGPPVRVLTPRGAKGLSELEAAQPLVSRLPADSVASAQLSHGVKAFGVISNEVNALLHGCSLHPGHRPTSRVRVRSRSLGGVSPMLPVRSVTYVPGLYQTLSNTGLNLSR